MIFHPLHTQIDRPEKFTFPFCYRPHPLCVLAANEVQEYIKSKEKWHDEAENGKMFGVLIVEDSNSELGYLAAYSGILMGRNDWDFFVPAVFDALQPNGYFKKHEDEISEINRKINEIESNAEVLKNKEQLKLVKTNAETEIYEYQKLMKDAKIQRDKKRNSRILDRTEEAELIKESQFMKAELKRIRNKLKDHIDSIESKMSESEELIRHLKIDRKRKSDELQHWLFEQFDMMNALGEEQNLIDIFKDMVCKTPPAGAGECCAPKLLQYAYLNKMRPVCMAEFWWGKSPKTEIRHHKHFYPACQGKCKPILAHMMKGLDVDKNPLELNRKMDLETIYNDEWLTIVNKPAGMLSIPGKSERESVLSIVKEMYPTASGPMIVHRLDMATSGLLIVAKTKDMHKMLQSQFKDRNVKKKYIAIVDGIIPQNHGIISLPLIADGMDRPRQIVDFTNGKTAITEYDVIDREGTHTRLALFPHTGRTHQLRIHCAHLNGLNAPIVGDELYGKPSNRLYLHAEKISFVHPITGKTMTFETKADF
jgi:tRNA pseudouridine32 synthase / 23S rRNA pseudouridine746 synthase